MVKYSDEIVKKMKTLFGDNPLMMEMTKQGDPKLIDMLYSRLGFYLDEDDIIKAFRNKKEQRVLDMAKRAKSIRELYQQVLSFVDAFETDKADRGGYSDCL